MAMNHRKFLSVFIPGILVLSLIALLLPGTASLVYIKSLEVLVLFSGAFVAWQISKTYTKELHRAFIFLALFLCIFAVAIITLNLIDTIVGSPPIQLVIVLQVINYAMLILACIYIIRVVDVRQLNLPGWLLAGLTFLICVFVALYPPMSSRVDNVTSLFVFKIAIRLVDAALITILVPVIWLYIQYLKTQQQQSLTFTVIVSGIVVSIIFDYILQSVVTAFPGIISIDSNLYAVITEIIYAYGFSVIMVGLFAHLKHDEWGFRMIEKGLI